MPQRGLAPFFVLIIALLAATPAAAAPPEAPGCGLAGALPRGRLTRRPTLTLPDRVIEPRMVKPRAFIAIGRRSLDVPLTADERARLPAPLVADLAAWRTARGAAVGEPSAARQAREARRDAARGRLAALARALAASPDTATGGWWVLAAEALVEQEEARMFAALEDYERRVAAARGGAMPPEPRAELGPAAALLDRFLTLQRAHPARGAALYLRAWLAGERRAPDDAVVAAWQRATAELPAGPLAAEAQLRLGETVFDSGDARRLGTAATAFTAALGLLPMGDRLRARALHQLGVTLARQSDPRAALGRFLQLAAEGGPPGDDLVVDAEGWAARLAAGRCDPGPLVAAPLPAAARARLVALGAGALEEDGDEALALAWLEQALTLAPEHREAPVWDAQRCRVTERRGRLADAARCLGARAARFGPGSTWHRANAGPAADAIVPTLAADAERAAVLGQPASGRLTPTAEEVARRLAGRMPGVRRCYEQELAQNPRLAGVLSFALQWAADGAIVAARSSTNSTGSDELGRCVLRQLGRARLPGLAPGAAAGRLVFRSH
jgi:tetratricopeptide (TPR) repeat protein